MPSLFATTRKNGFFSSVQAAADVDAAEHGSPGRIRSAISRLMHGMRIFHRLHELRDLREIGRFLVEIDRQEGRGDLREERQCDAREAARVRHRARGPRLRRPVRRSARADAPRARVTRPASATIVWTGALGTRHDIARRRGPCRGCSRRGRASSPPSSCAFARARSRRRGLRSRGRRGRSGCSPLRGSSGLGHADRRSRLRGRARRGTRPSTDRSDETGRCTSSSRSRGTMIDGSADGRAFGQEARQPEPPAGVVVDLEKPIGSAARSLPRAPRASIACLPGERRERRVIGGWAEELEEAEIASPERGVVERRRKVFELTCDEHGNGDERAARRKDTRLHSR